MLLIRGGVELLGGELPYGLQQRETQLPRRVGRQLDQAVPDQPVQRVEQPVGGVVAHAHGLRRVQ
ncbi:MAG: hypothetical protein E6F99_24055 [Actinobacteria bacterium]|nr:MAG: hypothetical protein E6F99_24055 [Actinomycetota bacterium]